MTILLSSNSGRECVSLEPLSLRTDSVEFSLRITSQLWDDASGDWTHAATIAADSITLSTLGLTQLHNDIGLWLDNLNTDSIAFEGKYSLQNNSYQILDFVFSSRPELISTDDKPVLTIHYRFGGHTSECWFVTDQSCLAIFADGLKEVIPPYRGSNS